MKNYNEMANSVFKRRDSYETNKKHKRKILTQTLTPICCVCLVFLLGIGFWQGGIFTATPPQTADGSVIEGEKDWYGLGESEPSDNSQENTDKKAMKLVYGGKRYLEVTNLSSLNYSSYDDVVVDKKIGNGEDFEGTYNAKYLNEMYGTYTVDSDTVKITITSEVYTVEGNEDLLCVKLSNGDINILKAYD